MPSIEISDTDFLRLQKIAVPLIDTSGSVVTKLLDSYEQTNGDSPSRAPVNGESSVNQFGAGNIPPLAHAKLMAARFDNTVPDKITWDALVQLALTQVMERCKDIKDLRRLSGANVAGIEKHDEGYKPLPLYGFSYQGVSAQDAAKIVVRCAKALGCKASFEFEWRNKPEAHMPGERGLVSI